MHPLESRFFSILSNHESHAPRLHNLCLNHRNGILDGITIRIVNALIVIKGSGNELRENKITVLIIHTLGKNLNGTIALIRSFVSKLNVVIAPSNILAFALNLRLQK